MNIYAVCVYELGRQRGVAHRVLAPSALEAMHEVAARLGLTPASLNIEDDTGNMTVVGWHGYEFIARQVKG